MVEKQLKNALLLLTFVFASAYRFILMTWQTFPPGSDIGLHESVVKTITSGQTNFLVNYYHMGGGISATNPGYHIFVAIIIAMTGMPDYLAHSVVACLFSTITVLCVFLVVSRVWSKKAAYVATFMAVFSAGDSAMLSWGGYPNIIALMLIPIVFYFFLQRSRFSKAAFFATTSLLVGSIFLTHIFSAFIFISITMLTLFFSVILSKKTKFSRYQVVSWLTPIVIGALLVLPYLYNIIPIYFSSGGTITGTSIETNQALLETRVISNSILILSIILGLSFFLISKYYKNNVITIPAILFTTWIIVPAIMTQGYIFGLYLDYERFLYFLFFPLIVCIALLIVSVAKIFPKYLGIFFNKIKMIKTNGINPVPTTTFRQVFASLLISGLLILVLFFTPLLTSPIEGFAEASYYQVMTPLKYDAIQWIKNSTENSVFVADAEYGWWLSGFAQRPTLSAINPQFLILAHELEPARVAKNLLSTDYFIDNGIIKINYYNSDNDTNSHELLARISGSYVLHPFFSIKDTNISVLYRNNGKPQHLSLNQLTITNIEVNNGSNWASFSTTRENELLHFSESLTIQADERFAKVSMDLQSKIEGIRFDWLYIPFISSGTPAKYQNSIVFADESIQARIPILFSENQLGNTVSIRENSDFYELIINNEGISSEHFEFSVGFQDQQPSESNQIKAMSEFSVNKPETGINSNQQLSYFDYKKAINTWNVSYVVVTDAKTFSRFANHQSFNLIYKNSEVAIFKEKT